VKIEFGALDWQEGECQSIHESSADLEHFWQQRQSQTIEGFVRIVNVGQPVVRIYDDLWALLINLGCNAVNHCLGQSANRYEWLLTVQAGKILIVTESSQISLHFSLGHQPMVTARYSYDDFWPAAVAAASRFLTVLERLRGSDDASVRILRETCVAAQALVAQRGWILPPRPALDPPPPALSLLVRWVGLALYTRDIESSRQFYRHLILKTAINFQYLM